MSVAVEALKNALAWQNGQIAEVELEISRFYDNLRELQKRRLQLVTARAEYNAAIKILEEVVSANG